MQQLQRDSNDDIHSHSNKQHGEAHQSTELTLWHEWATYTAIKLKMSQTETTRSHKSIVNSICCYTANITSVSNCRWTCAMLCLSHIVLRIKVDAHSNKQDGEAHQSTGNFVRPMTVASLSHWASTTLTTRCNDRHAVANFWSPDFGTKFQREVARSLSSAMSSGQKPARITIHKRFP